MRTPPLVLAALLLAGCSSANKPTPQNYLTALNQYLPEHTDCLLDASIRFPFETGDPALIRQLDTLAAAQVLDAKRSPSLHVTRYTLTSAGERAGQHLCYGHRLATAIVSSTPPAVSGGFNETQIVFRYQMQDAPIWAQDAAIQAVYPKLAQSMSGTATAKITLAQTGVGWEVPD
jgi:hypothetical protein